MEKLLLSFLKPQLNYHSSLDLGPNVFNVGNKCVKRLDLEAQKVPFSLYTVSDNRPIIVYAHSYNSNRLQATTLLKLLLEYDFNVATIEFQRVKYNEETKSMEINHNEGCISFGFYESEQIHSVIQSIEQDYNNKIYIWGRSMGAVSALVFQNKYKSVNGLILDSPFHSLAELYSGQFTSITKLPKFIGTSVVFICNPFFQGILKYNISQMDILQNFEVKCPVFFIVNKKDQFSGVSCQLIYDKCSGYKKLLFSEAEHSASRERHILQEIIQQINKIQKPFKMRSSSKKILQINEKLCTEDTQEVVKKRPKSRFLSLVQKQNSYKRININKK